MACCRSVRPASNLQVLTRGGEEPGNLPSDPQPPPASHHREQEHTQSRVTAPPTGREAEHKTAQWHSNYQSPPRTAGGPVFMQQWRRCRCSRISFCFRGSAERDGRCPWCWTCSQCCCRCPLCWTSRCTAAETETFQTHTFTIIPIFQKDCFDLNACIIFSPNVFCQ